MTTTSDFNRTVSRIFTNPTFRNVLKDGDGSYVHEKLKKYSSYLPISNASSVKTILEQAYIYLGRNYRNEYIYKNTIANKILLGRHNLNTTTLLSEFKVGGSIADLIMLNGTSTVYEIKTELDYPDKLIKQIEDYRKAFAKIYLVTHHSLTDKYLQLLANSSIGLLSLNNRLQLSTIKEAEISYANLDIVVMMKTLRKAEYSSIIKQHYGFLPITSNIKYFSSCIELAKEIDPIKFHDYMLAKLKKRVPVEKEYLQSNSLPFELKHICLCLNPSRNEYNNLFQFLNTAV